MAAILKCHLYILVAVLEWYFYAVFSPESLPVDCFPPPQTQSSIIYTTEIWNGDINTNMHTLG